MTRLSRDSSRETYVQSQLAAAVDSSVRPALGAGWVARAEMYRSGPEAYRRKEERAAQAVVTTFLSHLSAALLDVDDDVTVSELREASDAMLGKEE